ncbi:MAG: HAD-superfamily hydrolase, subfamily [Anaerocolumna sp.]|jgi:Cof subfamily protein (haloacid dehalogenase superfamily)|nr:HAD-superfamily hydrolase, subfamily [Anaerocolumna sp.]
MAYEILVLDIDGTLTNSNKDISPKTLDAIMSIQERKHTVVLASGRPTPGITALADKLRLSHYGGYILSYNGAKIINCKTGEVIYEKVLPADIIPSLHAAAIQHNVGIISYEGDHVITDMDIDEYMMKEAKINSIPIKAIKDFPNYITFPVNKCLITGHGDKLAEIEPKMKEQFGDRINIYRSEPFFLELMPHNIDKANSLKELLKYLNLTNEQMISCGDGYNDLSMIEYAGMGVAMANAQEIVKKAANYITFSNDEDGVAHVIEEFMF